MGGSVLSTTESWNERPPAATNSRESSPPLLHCCNTRDAI